MSSNPPPNPWFNQIDYNPTFFNSGSSTGVTLSYVNANFLRITSGSNPVSSANTTTFSGQLIATASASSVISNANNVAMTPISSGVIYLTGVTAFTTSNYPLITDSFGHLSFATGTNTLNVGISGSTNGNLNLYGVGGTLTIPASTGTAINVPNGNILAATLTSTGNLLFSNATSATINTTSAAAFLNINTASGGSGYINFSPQNNLSFQISAAGNSSQKVCDFAAGLTMSGGAAAFNSANITTTGTLGCGAITTSGINITGPQLISTGTSLTITSTATTGGGISIFPAQIAGNLLQVNTGGNMTYAGTIISAASAALSVASVTTSGNINLTNASSFIQQTVALPGNNLVVGTVTGGGGLYLNGQGVTSILLTGTAIQNNLNTTLPTAGVVPTAGTQLGGSALVSFGAPTALASATYRALATSATLPVGTYLFNGNIYFTCTTAGTVSNMGGAFSSGSASFPAFNSQLASSISLNSKTETFAVSATAQCFSCSCLVTVTVAAPYYLICYWTQVATAVFTASGSATFTRIA